MLLLLPAVDAVVFVSEMFPAVSAEIADDVAVAVFVTKVWMLVKLTVLLLLSVVDAVAFALVVTVAVGTEIGYVPTFVVAVSATDED